MKKIIAIAVIALASTSAQAFWGNNDSSNGTGHSNNVGNGDLTGAGEGSFSMSFSGKANSNGSMDGANALDGNAISQDNGAGNTAGNSKGDFTGAGEGSFSMSFSGKANTAANSATDTRYYGTSQAAPAPVAPAAK